MQNPAPVPGSGLGSGSGPGPSGAAAPLRGAAPFNGPGPDPDPGLDPGTGAGFCQSTVYGDGGWFSLLRQSGHETDFYKAKRRIDDMNPHNKKTRRIQLDQWRRSVIGPKMDS